MANKTINLNEKLYAYLLSVSVRETNVAKALREETGTLAQGKMQTSPDEANFLALLVKLTQAQSILEVGTFTGYATLHMAMALPDSGRLVTCDINEDYTNIAKRYWAQANVDHKIQLVLDPAEKTLSNLLDTGKAGTVDLVFIDANKSKYLDYYELCYQLVKPGGVIAIDNVLWHGNVIDKKIQDKMTKTIRETNATLYADERVDISMLSIGDGLLLALKK